MSFDPEAARGLSEEEKLAIECDIEGVVNDAGRSGACAVVRNLRHCPSFTNLLASFSPEERELHETAFLEETLARVARQRLGGTFGASGRDSFLNAARLRENLNLVVSELERGGFFEPLKE